VAIYLNHHHVPARRRPAGDLTIERDDPLWLPEDRPSIEGEVLPATGWTNGNRKRTPEMEAIVLDIVARTGSPRKAAELVGIHPQTIQNWRSTDADLAARYRDAMASASELVMGKAHERERGGSGRMVMFGGTTRARARCQSA
jgi:hypothetical protein